MRSALVKGHKKQKPCGSPDQQGFWRCGFFNLLRPKIREKLLFFWGCSKGHFEHFRSSTLTNDSPINVPIAVQAEPSKPLISSPDRFLASVLFGWVVWEVGNVVFVCVMVTVSKKFMLAMTKTAWIKTSLTLLQRLLSSPLNQVTCLIYVLNGWRYANAPSPTAIAATWRKFPENLLTNK